MILQILKHRYMNKFFQILAVAAMCLLFKPVNICYSQEECPHFKIAESVEGERIAYAKPIKCVELDLNYGSQDNVLSYDIDNDGFDEKISYTSGESGLALKFKIEGLNPNGGVVHDFGIDYYPALVGDGGNGVWLYIADVYGDSHPEVLAFSYFSDSYCALVISTYSNNRFIDRYFSLNADDVTHMYIKNQKLVRNYNYNGKYQIISIETYNLKIKNSYNSSWEVYVDGNNYGTVQSKKSKTFKVPVNIYKKIVLKQVTKNENPLAITYTRDKKPNAEQDVNCNVDTYFLQISNVHSDPRNVYVDGYYFGQVPGKTTKKIEVVTTCYKKIKLEQSKGYLMSPNIENFTLENRPNAVINIKN